MPLWELLFSDPSAQIWPPHFHCLFEYIPSHMAAMRLKNAMIEHRKKPDISEKPVIGIQGGSEHDIADHFHISIQEIRKGSTALLKRTRSRRQSG
jgi:hypothetical protein